MLRYLFRRILISIPTMLILLALVFAVIHAVPGGPFDSEKTLSPEVRIAIEQKFNLHNPVWKQFIDYIAGALQGDLGPSYRYMGSRDVDEIIADSFPVSALLGFWALMFAVVIGIPTGVLSAFNKGSWFDFTSMFFALAGVSLPSYLVASILIMIFSIWLGWFPPALWEDWTSIVLPAIALGLRPLALIARITRASVLETLTTDYIRTARAKGLPIMSVLFKHSLKNAMIPVITVLGPIVASLVAGSFVIEMIFAIPGMGKHFVSAVVDRDYTLIMGLTLVYGLLVIVANLVVDLLYGFTDPRIRVEG